MTEELNINNISHNYRTENANILDIRNVNLEVFN